MRTKFVVTTATLIAITAFLPACSSTSSPKSSATTTAPAGSTTSASSAPTSSSGAATALTCTKFAGTLTLSPPVSLTVSVAHTLTARGTVSGCTGTPGITSGVLTFVEKETTKLNCAELLTYTEPGTASVSVNWDNGKTSMGAKLAVTYASVTSSTISGKFTSGTAFVGKTSSASTVNTPNGGGCVTNSLTTATLSLTPGTEYTIR